MMKRLLPVACAALLFLSGCAPSAKDIAEKMASGAELSDSEYAAAIEYASVVNQQIRDSLSKYGENPQGFFNSIHQLASDSKNQDIDAINRMLLDIDPSTLSEENAKALEKLLAEEEKIQLEAYELMGRMSPVRNSEDADLSGREETPGDTVVTDTERKVVNPGNTRELK